MTEETLPAVTAAREALAREHQAVEDVDIATGVRPEVSHLARPLRDLLAVVERLTAPPSEDEIEAGLKAWFEHVPGANYNLTAEHVKERNRSRMKAAIVAASGRRHLPTETDQWEYSAGYEGDPGTGPQWFAMDSGAFTIREAAEREVKRYGDAQIRLIRRCRPGPWEVCDEQ